jgi:uncharacterized protein
MSDIVSEIKKYVENECNKPTSKYGYEPFSFHFIPTVNYALELQSKLGGDKEIIEIAAWLHDIGSIIEGRENHHISGTKIAEAKLLELNYPEEKIELVKKCILNHRGSVKSERDSIEEKIIAEADILSNFDNIAGIFKAAFTYEGLTQGEAQAAVKKKLTNKWNQLHFPESKTIVAPKYNAAMIILE